VRGYPGGRIIHRTNMFIDHPFFVNHYFINNMEKEATILGSGHHFSQLSSMDRE
jgi:hypothetical protein